MTTQEANLDLIPVFIGGNDDPHAAALASYMARRNLDKGGKAFVLFEANPEIVATRQQRMESGQQQGNLWKQFGKQFETSFSSLADKYVVPREYFSYLAAMWDASNKKDWDDIRTAILNGIPLTSVYRGWLGKCATKGEKRNPVDYAKCFKSFFITQFPAVMKHWPNLTPTQKADITTEFNKTLAKLPADAVSHFGSVMMEFAAGRDANLDATAEYQAQ